MTAAAAVVAVLVALWVAHRTDARRRMLLRIRWPSAARSSGLGRVERKRNWLAVSTTELGRTERLPTLSCGRRVDANVVRYRVHPARGGSLADIAEAAERLAAALRVARVEVHRELAHRGVLTVVWP